MTLPIQQKAVVQTERLTLKPYSRQDIPALAELLQNPEITETFMVPTFETPEQAISLAEKLVAFSQPEDTSHLEYGVFLHNRLIGFVNDCGMEDREVEIGYVIHPNDWGCGYATEAATAVIQELWEMGFRRVTAGFFEENAASQRVLEKCGMHPCEQTDEEEYRGIVHKCLYYEICL